AELEDDEFLAATLRNDLAGNLGSSDGGRTELGAVPADEENVVERDLVARIARELFDADGVARGDSILLAAGADNCVCHGEGARKLDLRRGLGKLARRLGRQLP